MKTEIDALVKRTYWKVCDIPRGTRSLRWHFVYKIKYKDGEIDCYKSRLDGSQQTAGVDFKETFAPVVKFTSVLAICVVSKIKVH